MMRMNISSEFIVYMYHHAHNCKLFLQSLCVKLQRCELLNFRELSSVYKMIIARRVVQWSQNGAHFTAVKTHRWTKVGSQSTLVHVQSVRFQSKKIKVCAMDALIELHWC